MIQSAQGKRLARIRTIKPDFFRHEALYEAERETGLPLRVAYAGLWTAADREGRFKWSPRSLKLDCLPYDDVDFSRVLDALWTRGWLVKFAVDGAEYGAIPSWKEHQVINNREKASDIPEPKENNTLTREPRVNDACGTPLKSAQGEGKGREWNEDAANAALVSSPDKQIYDLGKQVLGSNSGGLIKKLIAAKDGILPLAHAALLTAQTKSDPREYVGRIVRNRDSPEARGDAW